MSSKGDIFDTISASKGDIFDQIGSEKKAIGREGTVLGGLAGGALEALIQNPSLAVTELPVAAAKTVEAPVHLIQSAVEGAQKLLGSNLPAPELKNSPSEFLKKYVRSNLPEELHQGAEDVSDIESFLLPFIKARGAKTFGTKLGGPGGGASGGPSAGKAARNAELKRNYEERAALAPKSTGNTIQDVKQAVQDVREQLLGPKISEKIPESISPQRIKNSTSAGMDLEKAVAVPYKKLSAEEKRAYDLSRAANRGIEEVHPDLLEDLQSSLIELEKIPDPSAPLARYIKSTKKLIEDMSEIAPDGSLVGYKPISNQTLINQIQEYNQIPKYDFPTDTKTGIFKTLINKLTQAVDSTAAKFPEANRAWQNAKRLHSEKSVLFDDPDVSKWIKLADKNYSKDFLSSIDIDKIRKLEPVLKLSDEGKMVLQQMKREMVEKTLENNFSIGTRFDKKQISRKLAELEPILTPEEMKVVEKLFEEAQTPGARITNIGYKFLKYARNPSGLLKEASKLD